jgi:helix-turn-helix protein
MILNERVKKISMEGVIISQEDIDSAKEDLRREHERNFNLYSLSDSEKELMLAISRGGNSNKLENPST